MRPLVSIVALVALVAAACGSLDIAELERIVEAEVEEQTSATVASIDCPDDVAAEAGATFTCTATGADGGTVEIAVTQKDDEGNVEFTAPLLHVDEAEQVLAGQLGEGAAVECPDALIVVAQGGSFSCSATDAAGEPATVNVTFSDDQGNIDYEVVPGG